MTPAAVTVVTQIPSPYQVELWDAVARSGAVSLRVIYVQRADPARQWSAPVPAHDHVVLDDGAAAGKPAEGWAREADLLVAAWYADARVRALMAGRVAARKAWAFWGERPGASRWQLVGRARRWWLLRSLRRCRAPIWGIGEWAVEAWRREFGDGREYVNFPYFSDLARFAPPPAVGSPGGRSIRFLFSGSLTARKGVDLLAEAFVREATAHPTVTLDLVGAGNLEPALRTTLAPLGGRVRFLGFTAWADLPGVYHRADVLVAPSRYDGWGLIVPEGLAAGLPVIATDQMGAARDLIRPGENGWVVRAGSLDALRAAIAEAASLTPERLARMRSAALGSVGRHQLADGVGRFVEASHVAIRTGAWED